MLAVGEVLWGEYRVTRPLGCGGYAEVYQAKSLLESKRVAIKVEKSHTEHGQTLEHEAAILSKLTNIEGIPKVTFVKKSGKKTYLGLQLLGKSLYSLRKSKSYLPTAENQVLLAWHLLALIESVHKQGILHMDIKPDNILVGRGKRSRLYLIDFGIARDISLPYGKSRSVLGNPLFCSSRRMENRPVTRKDDLEGWLYTLVFMTNLHLPWDTEARSRQSGWIQAIKEAKETISAEQLCKDLPREFVEMTNHIRSVRSLDRPNYTLLKGLLAEAAQRLHLDLTSPLQIVKERTLSETNPISHTPVSHTPSQFPSLRAASCVENLDRNQFQTTQNSDKFNNDEMNTEKDITVKCAPALTVSVKNYLKDNESRLRRRGSAYE